jgi:hypothetical protein
MSSGLLLGALALGVLMGTRAATSGVASGATEPLPTWVLEHANGEQLSADEMKGLYRAEAEKPRFEGQLIGWSIAPYSALEAQGSTRHDVSRSCKSFQAGAETPTKLDFVVGYLPDSIKVRQVYGPIKWVCGSEGLSVRVQFDVSTPLGIGEISIERVIRADRVIEMDVPADSVEVGKVNGHDAVFAHPMDDQSGRGIGRVFVIEEDEAPEFTILRIYADEGVPFDELVKIAEGIK